MTDGTPTAPEERKYHLVYSIAQKPEGVPESEIPEGSGACDAMVLMSLVADGDAMHFQPIAIDGRKDKSMGPSELFNVWIMLAHVLANSISDGRGKLCREVLGVIQQQKQVVARTPKLWTPGN